MRNTLVLIVTLFALSACVSPNKNPVTSSTGATAKYVGTWEGTLTGGAIPEGEKELVLKPNFRFRLVINKDRASVYVDRNGGWAEIKPGKFQLAALDTNIVIFAIASGIDNDGIWIETWSFAATVVDATHLHVMWQRQVRNRDMDLSDPNAVFGVLAYGELTRAPAT